MDCTKCGGRATHEIKTSQMKGSICESCLKELDLTQVITLRKLVTKKQRCTEGHIMNVLYHRSKAGRFVKYSKAMLCQRCDRVYELS